MENRIEQINETLDIPMLRTIIKFKEDLSARTLDSVGYARDTRIRHLGATSQTIRSQHPTACA